MVDEVPEGTNVVLELRGERVLRTKREIRGTSRLLPTKLHNSSHCSTGGPTFFPLHLYVLVHALGEVVYIGLQPPLRDIAYACDPGQRYSLQE